MADSEELPAVYEELLRKIHAGELAAGMIDAKTTLEVADFLMEGMFEGYGKTFDDIAYNTPDFEMLANLERNVYQFSSAKNYQMLKALTLKLKDGKTVRTFLQFRKEAAGVLDEWVGNWLRAEYDTAVASAQMASKWVQFSADKDVVPNLEYSTAGDERVRQSHRALDGVIKPVDDSFWQTYYPPNGWNCRCNVIQSYGGAVTTDADIVKPDVPKMFRTNMAETGVLFPPDHPYYVGLPAQAEKVAMKLNQQNIKDYAKEKLAGKVVVHPDVKDIHFSMSGIKEALNQPHKHMWAKNQSLYDIERLIKEAELVRSMPDGKGRPLQWYYLRTYINGDASYITIKEDLLQKKRTFYTIVDGLK